MKSRLRALRLTLELLLGRRLILFAVLDAVLVGSCLLSMLLQPEGAADSLFLWVFQLPSLALGLPALAGMVDQERRAGCLDLALATPAAETYFVRRAVAVCLVMSVQGAVVMILGWALDDFSFPLIPTLFQVAAVSTFLAAVALFWAVRLRTSGAVWLASAVTAGLMGPWLFFDPIPLRLKSAYGPLLPGAELALPWLRSLAVLIAGSILFFLYARRRLRRPELMLS